MPQKDFNTTLTWLQTRAQALQNDIESTIDDLPDTQHKQVLEQILRLHELTMEIQALGVVNILAHVRENNTSIDKELQEISDYVEQILLIHQQEHDNLQKIL
ncbi:hypothetical protein E2P71_05190 [Candidatus Bathyarchaeota archaeon]|nr:hypothetical protein E2P71_05190 [Candidatus Bathyarchaeota archaeon]